MVAEMPTRKATAQTTTNPTRTSNAAGRSGPTFISRAFVFVMIAHPILRRAAFFVAAFGGHVQEIVSRVHQIDPTRIRRVGSIDVAAPVQVKRAYALTLIDVHVQRSEIVNGPAGSELLRRERDVEVEVEIRIEGGNPIKLPAHAPFERFNFPEWRAGNDSKSCIALSDVKVHAVVMVRPERTMRATFFPARPKHEVINDELAFAAEQIAERHPA